MQEKSKSKPYGKYVDHKQCKEELIRLGFNVIDHGWPDFLCEMNGSITAVEAKSIGDKLKPNQQIVINLLKNHGIQCILYQKGAFKFL